MLPRFPEFEDVGLSHQDTVNGFLSGCPLEASEYNFTNIFAFRKAYDFKLSLLYNNLVILKDAEPVSVFCPVGGFSISSAVEEIFGYLETRTGKPYLERAPESFVQAFLKDNKKFTAEEDRDHFDYVYLIKDLVQLRGNRFHDKKNRINKFKSVYRYKYETLTPGLIDECLAFEHDWCEERDCEKYPGLEKERCAVLEMLKNFGVLNIRGGIIRVGDRIVALTLGEKFLRDTMVIHVEKANGGMPGLYQVINQEFLRHEAGDCKFVNREQDLGIEGLRQAKMSYNPLMFVKKYKIKRRGDSP
ncbi:MAG: DUF2156 domain-containing protein [Nitrospiraceae bacterium]|nr:MAG: DUF2156 domain-containing protein [Nitrospiraceae bacterium]